MRLSPFLRTGSGKTAFVLDRFREALRAGDDAIRLLAPTATMAQHLQNRLAREGFVFRRKLIQTLSGFVEDWAGDVPQAPDTVLYLIVEEAARRVNRPEFAGVAHMPGFCASLARTIAEFSSAGCDSARLASSLPESPLGAAFLAVYQEVDRELERRGLAMRAQAARAGGGAHRKPGAGRHTHHLAGWVSCAARSRTARHRRVEPSCGPHPDPGRWRCHGNGPRAAPCHGVSRGARGAAPCHARHGAGARAGDRARSGGDRAPHPGASRGRAAVPRDGYHRAGRRDLCSGFALDARALRHSRPLLLRFRAWSGTRRCGF